MRNRPSVRALARALTPLPLNYARLPPRCRFFPPLFASPVETRWFRLEERPRKKETECKRVEISFFVGSISNSAYTRYILSRYQGRDKRVENSKHLEIRNSSIETKERGGRERAGGMKGEKRKIGKRATPVEF